MAETVVNKLITLDNLSTFLDRLQDLFVTTQYVSDNFAGVNGNTQKSFNASNIKLNTDNTAMTLAYDKAGNSMTITANGQTVTIPMDASTLASQSAITNKADKIVVNNSNFLTTAPVLAFDRFYNDGTPSAGEIVFMDNDSVAISQFTDGVGFYVINDPRTSDTYSTFICPVWNTGLYYCKKGNKSGFYYGNSGGNLRDRLVNIPTTTSSVVIDGVTYEVAEEADIQNIIDNLNNNNE